MGVNVEVSTVEDIPAWIDLAGEVETLFGPMVEDGSFRGALEDAIRSGRALCCRDARNVVRGGVVIDHPSNSVIWLAVAGNCRGLGWGRALVAAAVAVLDERREISVQTFAPGIEAGEPARKLYIDFGFADANDGGRNPAGIPTVFMIRPPSGLGEQ